MVFLSAAVLCANSLNAQSMKDKLTYEKVEKRFESDHTKSVNERCGLSLKPTFDWPTFNMKEAEKFSIEGYCGAPLAALRNLCEKETAKKIIAEKIKGFVCRQGAERKLALGADGVVTYEVDFKSYNDGDYANDWFGDNL
jgi:hypothetical protein